MPATHRILGFVAVAALAPLAAGCGSKAAGPSVAQVSTPAVTTTSSESSQPVTGRSKRDSLVAFSSCMRSHGVPKFPDPVPVSGGMRLTIGHGIDPGSPQFRAAHKACEKLLPGGKGGGSTTSAADQAKLLAFAACMRSHGLPDFPDPQTSGGGNIKIEGGKSGGLNASSRVFQAAAKACQHLLPGGAPAVAR